ncbi:MAG: amino acid adenylation domain-containing protein [Verrucomicrobiota bacterium]
MKDENNLLSKSAHEKADLSKLSAEEKRQLLAKLLAEKSTDTKTSKASHKKKRFPLSPAQQRLWFIDQLQPGLTVYHIPATLKIADEVNETILYKSFNDIISRHEILRTRFISEEGTPWQIIEPQYVLPALRSGHANDIEQLYQSPFTLSELPLIRAKLGKDDCGCTLLHLVIHHIIADFWSLRVLMGELQYIYGCYLSNEKSKLPPLEIQYVDYAVWQESQQDKLQSELDYWKTKLDGVSPLLKLPSDRPRLKRQTFNGSRLPIEFSKKDSEALALLAKAERTTCFSALLSILQALLFRYSGQEDFCIGSTVSNREREETRNLIGLFVNNLVFRCQPTSQWTFRQWLNNTHKEVLEAFQHQQIPFEQVVDVLKIDRQLSHNPLFQVQFLLRTETESDSHGKAKQSLHFESIAPDKISSRFDLSLEVGETKNGYQGFLEYNVDLFDQETISRLAEHLKLLLHAAVNAPDQAISKHNLITPKEQQQINNWNCTAKEISSLSIHELISQIVQLKPKDTAVSFDKQHYTYEEIENKSNQLAHYLHSQSQNSNSPIALCLPRSEQLVISLLAILKSGSPYVPLDPSHPEERLKMILEDSEAKTIIVNGNSPPSSDKSIRVIDLSCDAALIAQNSKEPLPITVKQDALAYIIFTSGSTGKPKGVPIQHGSLVNLLESMAEAPGINASDTLLAVTTIAFDIATLELLLPLMVGAHLWIADEETASDGFALTHLLEKSQATIMQATPASWRLLLECGWRGSPDLKILCGGEALDSSLAKQLFASGSALWNLYGPTETTIWSGALEITKGHLNQESIPIGGRLANTGFHILDEQYNEMPIGIPGELYLSGLGLSPGYHKQESLTAKKFTSFRGTRLYATGDRARFKANGTLEFLGRIDHQIKLRGFRIELSEIESRLLEFPNIEAVVVSLHGSETQKRIVAWCQSPSTDLSIPKLKQFLVKQLPSYMIPSEYQVLKTFPLNPNGKVDRKKLPQPGEQFQHELEEIISPLVTETEEKLAKIWGELLERPLTNGNTNFFEAGGHSLLAARMIAQVRSNFSVELPLRTIFDDPTIHEFAQAIDSSHRIQSKPIQKRPKNIPITLSHAQQRQWVLTQLDPDNPSYNIPVAIQVQGSLNTNQLEQALQTLCQRHEVLHTSFPADQAGKPKPVLQDKAKLPSLNYLDLSHLPEEKRQQEIRNALQKIAYKPFDLSDTPLLRISCFKSQPNQHIILLVIPHLIGDAWSLRILLRDLLTIAQKEELKTLKLQYSDYAYNEQKGDQADSLQYWKKQLENLPPTLDLPLDFPRHTDAKPVASELRFTISRELTKQISNLSKDHEATLYMALLAAFKVLLFRYTNQTDLIIGSPIGHRPNSEWEEVVGMFVNTLALRTRIQKHQSFHDILRLVRQTVLDGFENQSVPFEQIVSSLGAERSWDHSPVFQTFFLWQTDTKIPQFTNHDLTIEPFPLPASTAKFDLTLSMSQNNDGSLTGRFEYRSDLFAHARIERMAKHFKKLLEALTQNSEKPVTSLAFIPEEERSCILRYSKGEQKSFKSGTFIDAFQTQATLQPTAIAVRWNQDVITYRELDLKSNLVAQGLKAKGIESGNTVGLKLPRTPDLVIAVIAVMKIGGIYVPIDPQLPKARQDYMTENAGCTLVLDSLAALPLTKNELPLPALRNNLSCYILYTSGSTGKPKGVTVSHEGLMHYLHHALESYPYTEGWGSPVQSSIGFDATITSLLAPLLTGKAVHLLPEENVILALSEVMQTGPSVVKLTPAHLSALEPIFPKDLATDQLPKAIVVGGEALTAGHVKFWRENYPQVRIFNEYGPTETVVGCCIYEVQEKNLTYENIPIGLPIANTQLYVLNESLNLQPIGIAGELYISGSGVAQGYWNQQELTKEKFLPNPFASNPSVGAIMYRTGDQALLRQDGILEYLGRYDEQFQFKGFRIEPGEIESVLRSHKGIKDACVVLRKNQLVAFVESDISEDKLIQFLSEQLPQQIIPSAIRAIKKLPLTSNGKIDRGALPDLENLTSARIYSPRNHCETQLLAIWKTVLGVEKIGIKDNFFQRGGDSILILQVIAKAQQEGISFTPRDLFQHPTIEGLATVAQVGQNHTQEHLPEDQEIVVPLTPIQEWFFKLPLNHPNHWNQSILLSILEPLNIDQLEQAAHTLYRQHPALRSIYTKTNGSWKQTYTPIPKKAPFTKIVETTDEPQKKIEEVAASIQSGFNLTNGPLWHLVYFELNANTKSPCRRLLIVCHHLLIDGISWRILLFDLQNFYAQIGKIGSAELMPPSSTVSKWVEDLNRRAFKGTEKTWKQIEENSLQSPLPVDDPSGKIFMGEAETASLIINEDATAKLLNEVPKNYKIKVDELLLAALARTVTSWTKHHSLGIQLEGHGRQQGDSNLNLSRTVGWLTSLFPVSFPTNTNQTLDDSLKSVKEAFHQLPDEGLSYGVLRGYAKSSLPSIRFNYLGQTDQLLNNSSFFGRATESSGKARHPEDKRDVFFDINAIISEKTLKIYWMYNPSLHQSKTIQTLVERLEKEIKELTDFCINPQSGSGYSESDFSLMDFKPGELDQLLKDL